ncbi:hypothetical protein OAS25_05775 [Alphaproteobacteria bacterium]|nr:hypothetical protein [Alphaproteobacteria bacterium]
MNNLEKIEKFLDNAEEKKLIICAINQEIEEFYYIAVGFFCENKKINLRRNIVTSDNNTSDLFGTLTINICTTSKTSELEKILLSDKKIITLTDYKNYKKYSKSMISINGYDYENDIKEFISSILKINNSDLLRLCLSNPALTFSETSKYMVNDNYLKSAPILNETNFIFEKRKEFYELKKQGADMKQIYLKLKSEIIYKKFNFLTY